LQAGGNSACAGQAAPYYGFIFVVLDDGTALPCAPLTSPFGSGVPTTYAGVDNTGVPFSGTFTLDLTYYKMRSGSGRGGGYPGTGIIVTDGILDFVQ
jgi:hypothetical protein